MTRTALTPLRLGPLGGVEQGSHGVGLKGILHILGGVLLCPKRIATWRHVLSVLCISTTGASNYTRNSLSLLSPPPPEAGNALSPPPLELCYA